VDIDNKVNKMMEPGDSVNKAVDPDIVLQEYFFPGGGIWKPMTVRAATREEAEEIHRKKREAATQANESEKVGDKNENNI